MKTLPEKIRYAPATFGESLRKEELMDQTQRAALWQETKEQTYLIITGSLTLATTLAFNQLAIHMVSNVSPRYRFLAQLVYFMMMILATVFLAVLMKVFWVNK